MPTLHRKSKRDDVASSPTVNLKIKIRRGGSPRPPENGTMWASSPTVEKSLKIIRRVAPMCATVKQTLKRNQRNDTQVVPYGG